MISKIRKKERDFQVLTHIIDIYVNNAVPVSSKSVSRSMGEEYSSATIRNIMSDLEERGYIEQPHTSAGRIPTDSGYRYYVDSVKGRLQVEREEAKRLATEYSGRVKSIKDVIETTSYLISRELHNAGIVMWPHLENFYLKRLELVKVKAETVLAVLVTMTNAVKNYIIRIDEDLAKPELERVANFINENYSQRNISQISKFLEDENKLENDKKIVGILRSTDLFNTLYDMIAACNI